MGPDTFDGFPRHAVALGAAPVFKFTETYDQFDDATRYAAPLHLLFNVLIEIQFHGILQTIFRVRQRY
jgi:hypothetical protein